MSNSKDFRIIWDNGNGAYQMIIINNFVNDLTTNLEYSSGSAHTELLHAKSNIHAATRHQIKYTDTMPFANRKYTYTGTLSDICVFVSESLLSFSWSRGFNILITQLSQIGCRTKMLMTRPLHSLSVNLL